MRDDHRDDGEDDRQRNASGGCRRTKDVIQAGTLPPGSGSTISARPSQTKEAPRVTTIEGSWRQWISAPISA